MPYRVRIFREDQKIGEFHWDKPLHETRLFATSLLTTRKADIAAIVDDDGKIVETVKR